MAHCLARDGPSLKPMLPYPVKEPTALMWGGGSRTQPRHCLRRPTAARPDDLVGAACAPCGGSC
eukprot:7899530-Lingulodinium_polyedra.AAC.1